MIENKKPIKMKLRPKKSMTDFPAIYLLK